MLFRLKVDDLSLTQKFFQQTDVDILKIAAFLNPACQDFKILVICAHRKGNTFHGSGSYDVRKNEGNDSVLNGHPSVET